MVDVRNATDTKSPRGFPNYGLNPTQPFPTPAQYDALSGGGTAPGSVPSASTTAGVGTPQAGAAAFIRTVRVPITNVVLDLGAADFAGIQLLELARPVMWLGGNFDIDIAAAGGSAMDSAVVELGVGTVVASADPIATTAQNIVTLDSTTLASKLGTSVQATAVTPLVAAVAGDVFLNLSATEATTGYTVTLNGFVELFYIDFAAA
jgi:hypothetical protein